MVTLVVGCNHRTAPLEVRERLALSGEQAAQVLGALGGSDQQCEGLILSTCNRVELYLCRPAHGRPNADQAVELLAGWRGVAAQEVAGSMYRYTGTEAIRHCFRVVSSLDSMMLGESQIIGQAREAVAVAERAGTVGPNLRDLFGRALAVARRVRSQTRIAAGRASVGSLAVDFARQIFAQPAESMVLMIGAGKMGQTAVRHLISQGAKAVVVTSRTAARAEQTARALGVGWAGFDELEDHLVGADIVISCTGSSEPIITRESFGRILRRRKFRPILIVDIAVPRDVEPAVGELEQVYLYNIDDLQGMVNATLADRRDEMAACNAIVEEELIDFLDQQRAREVGPVLAKLGERLSGIAEGELQWALPKLTDNVEKNEQVLRQFKHRLLQKILHLPATHLTERSRDGAANIYAAVLRELFGLEDEEE